MAAVSLAEPLQAAVSRLRDQRKALRNDSSGQMQRRAVEALAALASIPDLRERLRQSVGEIDPQFDATWLSLSALLESWNRTDLWQLIRSEDVEGRSGPEITAHFIASNTPLLAWTSIARAMLVESASIVRLPSNAPVISEWSIEFKRQLATVDSDIADLIYISSWPVNDVEATATCCETAETILIYGSDETVATIKGIAGNAKKILGFGSKISVGFWLDDAAPEMTARNALDVAIFDQQGCLSPQCIFVEGDYAQTIKATEFFAKELDRIAHLFSHRTVNQAATICTFSQTARFEAGSKIFQDSELRWTVVASPSSKIEIAGPGGCIYFKPFFYENTGNLLEPWSGKLQGVSVASATRFKFDLLKSVLTRFGVSYVCTPGELQRPPFSWREDGMDVLKSLL